MVFLSMNPMSHVFPFPSHRPGPRGRLGLPLPTTTWSVRTVLRRPDPHPAQPVRCAFNETLDTQNEALAATDRIPQRLFRVKADPVASQPKSCH